MIAAALALGAALGWGVSDFLGGLRSRTLPLPTVLLVSQLASLALLAAVVAAHATGPPGAGFMVAAAVAGAGELLGVAALYRGLAVGRMAVVAPAAAAAPVIPLLAGLVLGEIPGPIHGAGLVLAVAGIVVAARQRPDEQTGTATASLGHGFLAALGFGASFVGIDAASEGDVGWALLVSRLAAVTVIAPVALVGRGRPAVRRVELAALALVGVLVTAADTAYALATTTGLLGVVAVLAALHTVVTIALARLWLGEPIARRQYLGIAAGLAGVLTVAAA